jgi:hypothetical protein
MSRNVGMRRFVAVLVCLALAQVVALAQAYSTVNGTAYDPKGDAVAGATVSLVNHETGVTRTTKTSDKGVFQFAQVAPATYELRAEAPGFKTLVQTDVVVQVNTPLTLDMAFEVGLGSETVEIVAGEETINQRDATIGETFNEVQIRQLPIEGRNVVDLLSLQPGVVKTDASGDQRSGAVNGARSDQSNVTLDGADVNDQLGGAAFTSVVPITLDSVQEFRVITSNANADQGRSAGAQIALVTKSGNNEFHGSVYEFHRNTITTANDFFNNAAGNFGPNDSAVLFGQASVGDEKVPRPKLIRNVFGFSLGGPFIKDKFFFFVNYEGRRDASESSVVRTVPTATYRQGILRYQNNLDPGDPGYNGGISTITPAELRDLDPLGIGVNPFVLDYLAQFPLPNDLTVGDGLNTLGYRFNAPIKVAYNTYIARADYRIHDNHTLFWRGNLADDFSNSSPSYPGRAPRYEFLGNSRGMALGYTALLSSNVTNRFLYGLSRYGAEDIGSTDGPFIGFGAFYELDPYTYNYGVKVPTHNITDDVSWAKGNHTIDFGTNMRFIRFDSYSTYTSYPYVNVQASWLDGGGNELLPGDISSSQRSGYRTAAAALLGPLSYIYQAYNYNRDGTLYPVGEPVFRNYAADEYEFYVQDTWKMRPNLTVTGGVRYSLFSPPYEKNGLQVAPTTSLAEWFDLRTSNAAQGIPANVAPPVHFDLAGPANDRKGYYDWDKNNFAPRVSVAWSPDFKDGFLAKLTGGPGRSSVRGGFGVFFEHIGASLAQTFDSQGATGTTTVIENPAYSYDLSTAPRFTNFGAFPPLPAAPPGGFPTALPAGTEAITFGLDDTIVTPINYSVDFSVSREVGWGLVVEAAYVGRFARHRLAQADLAAPVNLVDPDSGMDWYTAAGLLADYMERGVRYQNAPSIPYFENLWPGLGASQGLTPTQRVYRMALNYAPDWTTVLYYLDGGFFESRFGPYAFFDDQYTALSAWRSIESASYNSGQVIVRKRFSQGLQFDFNYTYSKSIDLTSEVERTGSFGSGYGTGFIINPDDPEQNRGVSDYDVTHSVNTNWLWELPFGHGRAYFSDAPGWADALVGGWQLSGIFRATSGFPYSAWTGGVYQTNWNVPSNAVVTGNVRGETSRLGEGPNIFADPESGFHSFRTARAGEAGSRNVIRGDGYFTLDMGLGKEFRMPWEGHRLQFRWEVFNVTNTASFDVQSLNLDLSDQANFGKYSSLLNNPRVMQFGLRYEF